MQKIFSSKITIGIIIALVVIASGYFFFFHKSLTYQFVTVQNGSITEEVSLTGNTTPLQSVSLSFNASGIVSHTYSALGKEVRAGQVLAEQNTSDLVAQLHNAQAGLTLAEQHASASKSNLANVTAEQNILVTNAHRTLLNSTFTALTVGNYSASDAPTVSGTYICDQEGSYVLNTYGSSGGISVNYSGLEQGTLLLTDIPRSMGNCGLFLSFDKTKTLQPGIEFNVQIPNKNAPNYNLNYNAYQLALQTRDTAITGAQANVGADSSLVADAQIAQAQASIDSLNARIQNVKLVAPINGTITQFDAKVGQLATPGVPLVSIISNGGYEVDAGVSETDIGKVTIGDTVSMTLDAFPNETFAGSVFYIAPAETNTGGVISYQIKISFKMPDPRLKSGLTANINIQTKHKDDVLILPQYAILQNDQGTFIETIDEKGKIKQSPVKLGIQDQKGNVEIISGVTLGEQVLNIGLKVQ